MRGLSLVAASGGHSSPWCVGHSLSWPLLLQSTGFRRAGSVVVAHGPSCSAACGIFPDQGSNPCLLDWQADSQPLCRQGNPGLPFIRTLVVTQGHLDNPGSSPHLKTLDLITSVKSLLPWNMNVFTIPGIRTIDIFMEPLFCLLHPLNRLFGNHFFG